MSSARSDQLVFVVNISSFTGQGFAAVTSYEGQAVELLFDDLDEGVFLTAPMAKRIRARKGSKISIRVENGAEVLAEANFSGTTKVPRLSSAKVYYALGREGGAVLRIRKG